MKLTQEHIEKIEAYLSDREIMTNKMLAKKYDVGMSTIGNSTVLFFKLGIVQKKPPGINPAEFKEFIEWKRMKQLQAAE